jgi:hypothetical protein
VARAPVKEKFSLIAKESLLGPSRSREEVSLFIVVFFILVGVS